MWMCMCLCISVYVCPSVCMHVRMFPEFISLFACCFPITPIFCGHLRPKPSAVHVVPAGIPQSGTPMVTVALGDNSIQNRHQKPQIPSHFFGVFSRTSSDCIGLRCQKLNSIYIKHVLMTILGLFKIN